MAATPVATSSDLADARADVLAWLAREQELHLPNVTPTEEIVSAFMKAINGSGFTYMIEARDSHTEPRFEAFWQHRGAEFVGFQQPPPASSRSEAGLLGCAALLRNQWCRTRLNGEPLRGADRESLSA